MSGTPINRRSFLYSATGAVAAVGVGVAAWPFIHQANPDAAVRAAGDVVEVYLFNLQPAEQRVLRWHGLPIFVVNRTAAMLAAMQDKAFVARLVDAQSEKRQQPAYARNWHRSIDPAYAVLVGVCTYCRCVPTYFADSPPLAVTGGYGCPCCASRFDPAGRAYYGPAQYNLPVPPHQIGQGRIVIGKTGPRDPFSLESVEVI